MLAIGASEENTSKKRVTKSYWTLRQFMQSLTDGLLNFHRKMGFTVYPFAASEIGKLHHSATVGDGLFR